MKKQKKEPQGREEGKKKKSGRPPRPATPRKKGKNTESGGLEGKRQGRKRRPQKLSQTETGERWGKRVLQGPMESREAGGKACKRAAHSSRKEGKGKEAGPMSQVSGDKRAEQA